MNTRQQGFTLIELMIVVSIIGILSAIMIPAYRDYAIRTQVSEGIVLAMPVKTRLSEFFIENGTWPPDNAAAGLAAQADMTGKYTAQIAVANNVIEIQFGNQASAAISNEKITLTAANGDGAINWTCASAGAIQPSHLPASCR